jgi:hypothetical protein
VFANGVERFKYKNGWNCVIMAVGVEEWDYDPRKKKLQSPRSYCYRDGTCETLYPEGRLEIIEPSGARIVREANGYVMRVSKGGLKWERFPHGVLCRTFPSGQVETKYPNGWVHLVNPNGEEGWKYFSRYSKLQETCQHIYEDRTLEILYPDGRLERRLADGCIQIRFPVGKFEEYYPHHVRVTISKDGTYVKSLPNGWVYTKRVDNHGKWNYVQENAVLGQVVEHESSKGVKEILYPDGKVVIHFPHGVAMKLSASKRRVVRKYPNGIRYEKILEKGSIGSWTFRSQDWKRGGEDRIWSCGNKTEIVRCSIPCVERRFSDGRRMLYYVREGEEVISMTFPKIMPK